MLLMLLTLLASEADARRRRRRFKRQHSHRDTDVDGRRREHRRRRGREGATTLPTPVRHSEALVEGIPVGTAASVVSGTAPESGSVAAGSQCPPPVTPFHRDLCGATACLHHHQCPHGRLCCFNGCIHTCLVKLESPPVIDWLEDTSDVLPILDESAPPVLPVRYEDLSFVEGREEAVHLPGGCTISGTQYSQLQNFMKAPSIENCMCERGEVVCAVKMFHS